MCDFSLQAVASRPAKVGDKLVTTNFNHGTRGFAGVGEDEKTAVCVLPGTELAFDGPVQGAYMPEIVKGEHRTAIFRQINKDNPSVHHDCLEMPDGQTVMLTLVKEGLVTTVLQLPAAPKTAQEAKEQERAAFVG